MKLLLFHLLAALAKAAAAAGCTSAIDCGLNGLCTGGKCVCDKPWTGDVCQTMTFKPVSFPQGYGMAPNMTVWGGGAIYDGKQYHSYISTMANHCPLSTWGHNSRIDHGVADTIVGPYKFVDVAIPAWSHNSAPISLHDGSYAIVHIGDGTSKGALTNCNKSHGEVPIEALPLPARRDPAEQGSKETGGSTIHVSKSLAGPWLPLSPNTLGGCNNPAPWVHPNGTIYIVCGGSFKRSESISGPWTTVATFSHSGGPAGNYEDPFLYTDKRGHYHLIYHVYQAHPAYTCVNSTVSAHGFSEDGFTWHMSPTSPYGTQIVTTKGTITISTRERPKIYFDKSGQMTHLFNGVCSTPACPPPNGPHTGCVDCKYKGWDYTLIAPLAV